MKCPLQTISVLFAMLTALSAAAEGPTYSDPDEAKKDPSFAIQGEYAGEIEHDGGRIKLGVQVIAQGKGTFRAESYVGGLPGAGWEKTKRVHVHGQLEGGRAVFTGDDAVGVIENGVLTVRAPSGSTMGKLEKVERTSPTLGEKPPEGAIVLFDGENLDEWRDGAKMTEDGLLIQGASSKSTFTDHHLHIEFRLPYEPQNLGQARGNSGIYLQGRYEVQMLDSFGLEGKHNECGGIYTVKAPDVNMCLPPLAWQTYDIDYTAARYDEQGALQSPPRITVRHNGVVIHEDVELPADRSTTAAPNRPGPGAGPVYLQDHGNEVRYRNIWVQEKSP
jgi:hypothetical protein